jgi:hypothetical protein
MLGEKSLNKYARAGEIYDGTLGPDSALFTTTQLRLKSQSILLNHATDHRSLSLTPELSHYIRSCMGLSCMLKVPSLHFLLSKAPPTGVKGAPMKRPFFCHSFDLSLFFLPLLLKHVSNGILLINLVSLEDLNLTLFFNSLKVISVFF